MSAHDPHAERQAPEPIDPNWRHPVELIEPEAEETFTLGEVCEAIYSVLAELKRSRRVGQALDAMVQAVNLGTYYGENGQTIADRHGVSRQRINDIVAAYRAKMGIIGGAFAKRDSSRATYSRTNHRPRKRPCPKP